MDSILDNTLNTHFTIPYPYELTSLDTWSYWKPVPRKKGKISKVPYQLNGLPARPDHPGDWTSFEKVEHLERKGFLFRKEDGYTGIDIDNCRDPETGELSELAHYLLRIFVGAYVEVSPSGTGIKLWIRGNKPDWCTRAKKYFDDGQCVEIYDDKHYFTVTGNVLEKPLFIVNKEEDIWDLCEEYFQKPTEKTSKPAGTRDLGLEDQEILDKLFSFNYKHKGKVRDLYEGRWEKYYDSHSEADLAFCCYLAFLTKDEDTIDRIVSKSGLYREKWDRDDYKTRTIGKALDSQDGFYSSDSKDFLRDKIVEMALETLFSPFPYRQSGDLLTKLDLLATAYKGPYYQDDYIRVSTSLRDLQILKGEPDTEHVSRSITRLKVSNQVIVQETGCAGKASTYLIPIKSPTSPLLDISIYLSNTNYINNNTVFNLMLPELRFLSYTSLNFPLQRALLMIALEDKFAVKELQSLMRYTGTLKEFRRAVIHPLRRAGLINLDKKKQRYVSIRKDWRENLLKLFDQAALDKLQEQVEQERKEYAENFLHKPMQKMVEEFLNMVGAK